MAPASGVTCHRRYALIRAGKDLTINSTVNSAIYFYYWLWPYGRRPRFEPLSYWNWPVRRLLIRLAIFCGWESVGNDVNILIVAMR
jgi:hypothetical protein